VSREIQNSFAIRQGTEPHGLDAPSASIGLSPLLAPFVLVVIDVAALDVDVAVPAFTPKAACAERGVEQHEDQCQAPTESFFQLETSTSHG